MPQEIPQLDLAPLLPEFPIREECLYLDHASFSPLPRPVSRAILSSVQRRETAAFACADDDERSLMSCRHLGAELIGCELDDVSIIPSTSAGLSMIAGGLDWKEGDEIILGAAEFASNTAPWLNLASRGVRIRRFDQEHGRVDVERVRELMNESTRVVAISWVSFFSGWVAPLAELAGLCRQHRAVLVVDAIQGLGAIPMKMKNLRIDAVIADGRKWLMGPDGCALMATSPRLRAGLKPVLAGWKNVVLPRRSHLLEQLAFFDDGRRFESGAISGPSLAGLAAALDLISTTGMEAIFARIEKINRILTRILLAHGWELISPGSGHACSGIVAGRPPRRVDLGEARERLRERHIITAVREGYLRLSPHYYITTGELEALDKILGKCGL